MKKLVIFKLNGNLRKGGFDTTIEIGLDGDRAFSESHGKLPENPELADAIARHWEEKYRPLGMSYRIKPIKVTYDGNIHKRKIEACQTSAAALRDRANQWLKSESFQDLNIKLREELNREDEIRLLLRTNDPLLHKLPWHEWDFFDRYSNAEIAFSSPQFVRPPNPLRSSNKGKVKILVILGHSERINVERDRELFNRLDKNRAEVEFLSEPNGQQLNESLWEAGWDIIFFAGHSETVEDSGRIYINPTESLTFERDSQLWYGLRKAVERGLKLAIFNSCDGLGLAKKLDDLHIPQMIVMRDFVADLVAQEFLKQFLKNYISGQPLYLAAREAREFLQGMEDKLPCASWLPVIWQNPAAIPPSWDTLVPKFSPSRRKKSSWRTLLFASLVVTSLVLGVRSLGWLQPAELKTYDQMMRLRPDEGPDPRLLIVEVTEDDLTLPEQKDRTDSLSDLALSKLIEKLETNEPRAIGLNIIRDFPIDENVPQLREQFQQNDRVYGACRVGDTKTYPSLSPPPDLPKHRVGFTDSVSDSDGVVRRHLLSLKPPATSQCQLSYALSAQLSWHYLKQEGVRQSFQGRNLQLGRTVFKRLQSPIGAYQKADTRGSQILLNYRSSEEVAETVTLEDVLRDRVPAENVRDRIVLIGANNLAGQRAVTPYQEEFPVVQLQAHMTSQILSAVLDKRPLITFLPRWCDALWIFVWSGVGGVLAIWCCSRLQWGIAGGLALTVLWGASNILLLQGFWVPFIPAILGLGGASVLVLLLRRNSVLRPSPTLLGGLGAMLLLHILLVPSTPFLSGAIALATAGTAILAVQQSQQRRLS